MSDRCSSSKEMFSSADGTEQRGVGEAAGSDEHVESHYALGQYGIQTFGACV